MRKITHSSSHILGTVALGPHIPMPWQKLVSRQSLDDSTADPRRCNNNYVRFGNLSAELLNSRVQYSAAPLIKPLSRKANSANQHGKQVISYMMQVIGEWLDRSFHDS